MSSHNKRSSILKKRPSVCASSLESSPTETTGTVKSTKRIVFKPKKSVKEFFATDETATIWCNSYEVSADGTSPHLTVSDTTLKNVSKTNASQYECSMTVQKDKENVASVEERRISQDGSSIWNLSISACEDEKRRMKGETSINSSVLNSTERLLQEPTVQIRSALRQKQQKHIVDSNAMDISPAKNDGKLVSPRKTIFYHPSQNMFVTIDEVVKNNETVNAAETQSPNDTDINFFGPPKASSRTPVAKTGSAKVLFQTSNTLTPWRNMSVQTDPRVSSVETRSVATNADISAGWSSHVVGIDQCGQRFTFGNSQFDISEAWNSHPAAALKLKMLQQEFVSERYDPRISDGGGGGDDIDSTLAITQSVARVLGPGFKPVSLDSTRASEPEVMDITGVKANGKTDSMVTSMQIDDDEQQQVMEESSSDIRLPMNALSRARPSFVPNVNSMDQSEYPSPEIVVSKSNQRQGHSRPTMFQTVPMDTTNARNAEDLPLNASMQLEFKHPNVSPSKNRSSIDSRKTILGGENIIEDKGCIAVEATASQNVLRQTVYDTKMDEAAVEKIQTVHSMPRMESVKMDFSDLEFGRNSIGLDLVSNSQPLQETNKPKILRMPTRALNLNFGTKAVDEKASTSAKGRDERQIEVNQMLICEDPSDVQQNKENSRKTVHDALEVSIDCPEDVPRSNMTIFQQAEIDKIPPKGVLPEGRRTDFYPIDVSLDTTPEKRVTGMQQPRPTLYFNDKIEQTKRQTCPRQSPIPQCTVRRTDIHSLDISMESPVKSVAASTGRPTVVMTIDLDESSSEAESPKKNHPRSTMLLNEQMNQVERAFLKSTVSAEFTQRANTDALDIHIDSPGKASSTTAYNRPSVFFHTKIDENQKQKSSPVVSHSRPTMLFNEDLEQSKWESPSKTPENLREQKNIVVQVSSNKHSEPSRKTDYRSNEMEHTRTTITPDNRDVQSNPNRRLTSVSVQSMDETTVRTSPSLLISNNRRQRDTILSGSDMDQTIEGKRFSTAGSIRAPKFRQTIVQRESMDQTLVDKMLSAEPHQDVCDDNMEETRAALRLESPQNIEEKRLAWTSNPSTFQKSRQTIVDTTSMDETRLEHQKSQLIVSDDEINQNRSRGSFLKSRQTNFEAEIMNQTSRSPLVSDRNADYPDRKTRQSVFGVSNMDETKRSAYQNDFSVITTIAAQQDQTDLSVAVNNVQKTRKSSFVDENINQKNSSVGLHSANYRSQQSLRQTDYHIAEMDESCHQIEEISVSTQSILKQIPQSFRESSRQMSCIVENRDPHDSEPTVIHPPITPPPVIQPTNAAETSLMEECCNRKSCARPTQLFNKSCQTSYIEEPQTLRSNSIRQTVLNLHEMDRTIPSQDRSHVRKSAHSIDPINQTVTRLSPVCRSPQQYAGNQRLTVLPREDIDEASPSPSARFAAVGSKPRSTIYQQDSMDETAVVSQNARQTLLVDCDIKETPPAGGKIGADTTIQRMDCVRPFSSDNSDGEVTEKVGGTMSRLTLHCDDNMEHTIHFKSSSPGVSRKVDEYPPFCGTSGSSTSIVDKVDSFKDANPVEECPKPPGQSYGYRTSRQTILVPQDMDQSLDQSMETSIIQSPPNATKCNEQPRRTIIQSKNILEETCDTGARHNVERTSIFPHEPSPELKQEHSDFSFAIPHLPSEDCVLRSSAIIPSHRFFNAQNHTQKPVPQPIRDLNSNAADYSLTTTVCARVPIDDLSEISAVGDFPKPERTTGFPIQNEVSSFVLKEIIEPTITQPSVAVPVIQETPKKSPLLQTRKSWGSIFDRDVKELDESGISPLQCEDEVGVGGTGCGLVSEKTNTHDQNDVIRLSESVSIVVNDSSDDEFYDAKVNQEKEKDVSPQAEIAHVVREAIFQDRQPRGNLRFIEVDQSTMSMPNETLAGHKTLKFVDVNDLEQTTMQLQKRNVSQISKSVLTAQENDPLNISLTDDYPLKRRKTAERTMIAIDNISTVATEADETRVQKIRRVTFHQDVVAPPDQEESVRLSESVNQYPEVEIVTIKEECITVVEEDAENERHQFGQTLAMDPSVFIVNESDMLANESRISLVSSPNIDNDRERSTLKHDNTHFREYVNLTIDLNQIGSTSCIVIDDSTTVPTNTKSPELQHSSPERRLTLDELPRRIHKTRQSLLLNSTVASEVMYGLKQQVSEAKKACCSLEGNCNCCRTRKTMTIVRRDNVDTVRKNWRENFDRIVQSVSDIPVHDMPLDERINEILNRPLKQLSLPLLEAQPVHLPEAPSIWFLCENYMRSHIPKDASVETYNVCDLPETPRCTALIANKLRTENYRWFLDSSQESAMRLYLRHCTLKTIQFVFGLKKSLRSNSKQDDVGIDRLELSEQWQFSVRSPRLLAAHIELTRLLDKKTLEELCSQCPTTAHLMSLIVSLDCIVERVFSLVDRLSRILRNNGAVLERIGNEHRLRIYKVFEYEKGGTIHWNRVSVYFDAIELMERSGVKFHHQMEDADSLFPTEQQCGRGAIRGLLFLECLLWNISKFSTEH